jgi:glycosyltransferase involved in cell wall biosynthesis
MPATETTRDQEVAVSIIVPARNEEVSLGACLESLVSQTLVWNTVTKTDSQTGSQTDALVEIIVVDDHSTDRTREIAASFTSRENASARVIDVCVIEAGPLPQGWTGKNNAVVAGARAARGEWLLFTDADTVHLPGSLARALKEAEENNADLLSYSPEQIAVSFWEMAVLPVVFAELARQYPPSQVSDPDSPAAAANGQYILVKREAYDAVGGHAAIAGSILEDVALARAVKKSGRRIRFRYAADAVRTRMYRNFRQLRDGWTKNLALLFPRAGSLAAKIFLLWIVCWLPLFSSVFGVLSFWRRVSAMTIGVLAFARNTASLRRANFGLAMEFLGAIFGMPMFAYLLLRSKRAHAKGSVRWKDRTYSEKKELLATGH